MRAARFIAILWMVFLASGVSVARAGFITPAAPSVSGPGCTGATCTINSGSSVTATQNNDDVTSTPSANTIQLLEKFTVINYIDATFTVVDSGGVTEYYGSNLSVTNNTGFAWGAFHWSLIPGTANDGLDFDAPSLLPLPTSTLFATLAQGQDTIDWTGGSGVLIGQTVQFKLSIDVPDGITSFTLRGAPTVATVVPEPASLLLLGSGLAGLGLWRRRHS